MAGDFVCLNGTDFVSGEGAVLETSLKKYEGALLLLLGFGTISIVCAVLNNCIRRFVYDERNSLDTTFDAGGNVSASMTAVGVATQLLWPGDLMQSVTMGVKLGIAGTFWYCGSAIINMSLFPLLSYKLKTRAPGAKTYLQIVKARFGTPAHLVFIFFGLLINTVILATVFVGGIAVLQATISDASPEYCMVILVILCGSHALIGGLGSIFYVSYFTAVITYVVLSVFIINIMYSDEQPFGSLRDIFDRVNCQPGVEGNRDGSRFTFLSEESMIFAAQILFLVSSIMYCDQASWQSRIAAKPLQGAIGFLAGSFIWFTVPASIGLVAGMSYIAETSRNQSFALSIEQIDSGIVPAYMAEAAMGSTGAIMMLTMLTMVTMSTGSAEIMGITSIIVYDIYQTYIRPYRRYLPSSYCLACGLEKADPTKDTSILSTAAMTESSMKEMPHLPSQSHMSCECPHVSKCHHCVQDKVRLLNADKGVPGKVVLYSCPHHGSLRMYQDSVVSFKSWCVLWVSVALIPFGLFLQAVELDLNWTMMAGVVLTVPSFPCVVLSIFWAKTTAVGLIIGSISGLITGIGADILVAVYKTEWEGGFIRATSAPYPVLAGSTAGIFVSLTLSLIISMATHEIKTEQDSNAVWQMLRDIDNPLQPWSLKFAEDFPELTDGSYRPTQKELDHISRYGRYVSIVGSIIFFFIFIVIIPGVLASLEVMSFEEFEVWAYVMTIGLFISTIVIIVVTPYEEIKSVLRQWRKKKEMTPKRSAYAYYLDTNELRNNIKENNSGKESPVLNRGKHNEGFQHEHKKD